MAATAGLDMTLKAGANALGAARGGFIEATRAAIPTTTKDSAYDAEFIYGEFSWSMGGSGLYVPSDTAQAAFETAVGDGTTIAADMTTGVSGEQHFSGTVYVDSLEKTSPDSNVRTFSVSLTGSGGLTFADV